VNEQQECGGGVRGGRGRFAVISGKCGKVREHVVCGWHWNDK
jgi:hypothetical protein